MATVNDIYAFLNALAPVRYQMDFDNAGFLAGILQGCDVVTAGRMGAICGALATQTPGDVEGYPDAAQMEAALTGAAITYR